MRLPLNLKTLIRDLTANSSEYRHGQTNNVRGTDEPNSTSARLASDLENLLWMTDEGFWSHKGLLKANDEKPSGQSTHGLNEAASYYFSQTEVQHQDLDWFYVNALMYYSHKRMVETNEQLAGDQFAGAFSHGFFMLLDGQYGMGTLLIAGKALKWLVLLALLSLPFINPSDNGSLLLGIAAVVYILSSGYLSNREFAAMKARVFDRIWAANRAYSLIEFREHADWNLLAREIEDTRRCGVPWLPALEIAMRSRC